MKPSLTPPEERMDALMQATAPMEDLAQAIEREADTTAQLRDALARQRASVAIDDVSAVLHSCDEVSRLLLTLEETRRSRSAAMRRLTGETTTPLTGLESTVEEPLSRRLIEAREALRHAAQQTAMEAAVNHTVLRRAVEAGEAFLQALFSTTTEPERVYRTGERKDVGGGRGAGWLLDRKA